MSAKSRFVTNSYNSPIGAPHKKRPAAMCGPFRSSARGSARLAAQESRDFEMIVFRAAHDRGRTAMRIELRLPGRGGRDGRRRPAGLFRVNRRGGAERGGGGARGEYPG